MVKEKIENDHEIKKQINKDLNLSVKLFMAEDLKKLGLCENVIYQLLNIEFLRGKNNKHYSSKNNYKKG